jgi:putative peptide zinc metalloprotease protein
LSDPGAIRRAKIELLVRAADEDGFEVRQVPSALAYLESRPQRLDDTAWELAQLSSRVDRRVTFVLKNKTSDRYILLSEAERFLWDKMDGHTSLQEMATAYVLQFGTFDFDIIPDLIAKLRQTGFLTLRPASRLRRALARNRRHLGAWALEKMLAALERVTLGSRRVHTMFERIYRAGGWALFTRPAAIMCAVVAILGAIAGSRLWADAAQVAAPLGHHPLVAIIVVKLVFFLTLAGHQVVHGLSLIHHHRRVREFGFTILHGFLPTFYVDVTDIFMASRRARVQTAVSGTLVHLVLGSACFVVAAVLPHGMPQAFAAASGIIQFQAFAVSLYPFCFIEMDGYHVLVDYLGLPTLRHDAAQFMRGAFWRRLVERRPLSRRERIWVGYVALSTVSVGAFILFNVWTLAHIFH